MENILETVTSKPVVIIDDTNPEKGRSTLQELLQQGAFYDDNNGYTIKKIHGASHGEEIRIALSAGEFNLVSGHYDYSYNSSLQNGTLYLDAVLVRPDAQGNQIRSPLMPHFTFLFDHTMDYFKQQGQDIEKIVGAWGPTHAGTPNINWKVYAEGLESGLPAREAALLTPTGKAAARHGFTSVSTEDYKARSGMDDEEEQDSVTAYFTRP